MKRSQSQSLNYYDLKANQIIGSNLSTQQVLDLQKKYYMYTNGTLITTQMIDQIHQIQGIVVLVQKAGITLLKKQNQLDKYIKQLPEAEQFKVKSDKGFLFSNEVGPDFKYYQRRKNNTGEFEEVYGLSTTMEEELLQKFNEKRLNIDHLSYEEMEVITKNYGLIYQHCFE